KRNLPISVRSSRNLAQLPRQALREVGAAVELRRRVLEEDDPPLAVLLRGDERLVRVPRRLDVGAAGRDHADDRTQHRRVRAEQAHALHLGDVRRRLVVGEDPLQLGGDRLAPLLLAAVEADDGALRREARCERVASPVVPARDQLVVETPDGLLAHAGAGTSSSHGRPGSGTASEWRRKATWTTPSATRGAGREKYAFASTATVRHESGAPSRAARSASKPQGARTTSSGSAARTASHVVGNEASPARPRISSPPASSTISGTQWPAANGGSSHSATKTRRDGRPATAACARPIFARISATTAAPRSGTPSRSARRRTLSSISPIVRGSSDTTSAWTRQSRPTSALETAQTSQRSCVRMRSGWSESMSSSSIA